MDYDYCSVAPKYHVRYLTIVYHVMYHVGTWLMVQ